MTNICCHRDWNRRQLESNRSPTGIPLFRQIMQSRQIQVRRSTFSDFIALTSEMGQPRYEQLRHTETSAEQGKSIQSGNFFRSA